MHFLLIPSNIKDISMRIFMMKNSKMTKTQIIVQTRRNQNYHDVDNICYLFESGAGILSSEQYFEFWSFYYFSS
jgi:hypothetical protein